MAIGLKKGSLLDHGKYRIERILGQGGFGITYLATDLGLDKLRAIKEFFPKDYCDRDETTSRITLGTSNTAEFVDKLKKKFIKEARNIANLDQHQGIITIHAVFEENNTAYYVMDYIEGENLSEIVKRDGSLPVDKAIKYITEVGNALEYVHNHHINHLDIKPANIMVRRKDDSPILIDFGLSKQYDSEGSETTTTPTGTSKGFAPKEQYNENGIKEFSPQTDVYALAATLYYLITGTVPPHALELDDLSKLQFPNDFPPKLIPPIKKATNFIKEKRQASINDFIISLKNNDETTIDTKVFKNNNFARSNSDHRLSIKKDSNKSAYVYEKNNGLITMNPNKSNSHRKRYKYVMIISIIGIISISFFLTMFFIPNGIFHSPIHHESLVDSLNNLIYPPLDSVKPITNETEALLIESETNKPIITQGKRFVNIDGWQYSMQLDMEVNDGKLYINGKEGIETISDTINCNKNINADVILDQMESLAYYWCAGSFAAYIVDCGFYSNELVDKMIDYLKRSFELMGQARGHDPTAYNILEHFHQKAINFKNKWQNNHNSDEINDMILDADILRYILSEHPVQARDIYKSF